MSSEHGSLVYHATFPPPDQSQPRPTMTGRGRLIETPRAAAELLVPELAHADREVCVLLALDAKCRLLEIRTVSIGTIGHTFMSPREIYRDALLANAASILVAHNHPTGDPTPSADDHAVTRRLRKAGRTIDIELVDHLIIGNPKWVSLAQESAL